MSALLGILLICYSSRGHQLVFTYPPDPQRHHPRTDCAHPHHSRLARNLPPLEEEEDLENEGGGPRWGGRGRDVLVGSGVMYSLSTASISHSHPPNPPSSHSTTQQQEANLETPEKFLGFDTHFLSDILSPKVALCDRQFQLVVDDVTFVGHPTLLHADRPGTGNRFARMIQKKRLEAREMGSGQQQTQMGDETSKNATATAGPPAAQDSTQTSTTYPSNGPSNSSGQPVTTQQPLSTTSPTSPPLSSSSPSSQSTSIPSSKPTPTTPPTPPSSHQLSMFNVVFALQPDAAGGRQQSQVDRMYEHVLRKITAALKYEQLKRGYIRREAELILAIKDESLVKARGDRMSPQDLNNHILASSSLARTLADVYTTVHYNLVGHIVVNSSVDLTLQIPDSLTRPLMLEPEPPLVQNEKEWMNGEEEGTWSILRPYHALLLLNDPEEILKVLPLDPSPLLVELIQIVTPTQCFEELQTTLDCPLSQLYKLAAHLVHWQKAKIIDVISIRNVYVVSQSAQLDLLPRLTADFESRFPTLDLAGILAELSVPKPYSTCIPEKELRTLYLEVLTYLLRYDLVVQLHMYIYLMIPEHICNNPPALFIPDPACPTDQERAWINALAAEQPTAIAVLFLRLAPYFSGKYHVEEIVFRENLTKKDLRTVLNRLREVVVTALLP
ncbi:nitrogen permease regulator of amino acid transport activity 3-domain-containing protein [Phlyctochytrium arcticum]|nr:nitrogen permease regulator of amino acid transport activity 3-domain-containing protein [Phlyctochytrium arcticum]